MAEPKKLPRGWHPDECDCDRCMSALHAGDGWNPYAGKQPYRRLLKPTGSPPMTAPSERLFDPEEFAHELALHIDEIARVDDKTAAGQIGVSPSTICRLRAGKRPDVETFLRIQRWIAQL